MSMSQGKLEVVKQMARVNIDILGISELEDGLEWVNLTQITIISGESNGTPLQYSCLENPTDRGAW